MDNNIRKYKPIFILGYLFLSLILIGCGASVAEEDPSNSAVNSDPGPDPVPGPTPNPDPSPDTTKPTISISSPVNTGSYTTSSNTISISGSASDNIGVSQVIWTSDRGGSGTASGTNSWTIAGLSLQTGTNNIIVTAKDAAGNPSEDLISVVYNQAVSFVVDVTWAANADNPSGYNIYVGPSATIVNTLAKTLVSGSPEWDPLSPLAQLDSATVLDAVGSSSEVCIAIRAYNSSGLSAASDITCTLLPS